MRSSVTFINLPWSSAHCVTWLMLERFLERTLAGDLQGEASHPALMSLAALATARLQKRCPQYTHVLRTTAQPAVPRALQVVSAPPAPRRLELRGSRTDQSDLRSVLLLDS